MCMSFLLIFSPHPQPRTPLAMHEGLDMVMMKIMATATTIKINLIRYQSTIENYDLYLGDGVN